MTVKKKIDAIFRQYVVTALWSETETDTGEPLDSNYGTEDINESDRERMRDDCMRFYLANRDDIEAVIGKTGPYGNREIDYSDIGHDFWLTRQHHGAGFWDGDYPEPQAERLTRSAKAFGDCFLLADNGKVYIA